MTSPAAPPPDLLEVLRGRTPAPPGCEVHRVRVWPSVLVALALVAAGAWAYDYLLHGEGPVRLTGKGVLGLVAWPFICIWWFWNVVRAARLRLAGRFAWALSDTHFLYVAPDGSPLGPFPLASVAALTLHKVQGRGSPVPQLEVSGSVAGRPVKLHVALTDLNEMQLGLHAMQPSRGKFVFRALRERLAKVNPSAQVFEEAA